ncbi:hypothetical protein QUB63_29665 [Microcoleus sp. ARI1-B5]|uniref:hypothetical protein n=1 Tax=unclassified Microcoleus TaxID=2642155 RepID=UPI002FD040D6
MVHFYCLWGRVYNIIHFYHKWLVNPPLQALNLGMIYAIFLRIADLCDRPFFRIISKIIAQP